MANADATNEIPANFSSYYNYLTKKVNSAYINEERAVDLIAKNLEVIASISEPITKKASVEFSYEDNGNIELKTHILPQPIHKLTKKMLSYFVHKDNLVNLEVFVRFIKTYFRSHALNPQEVITMQKLLMKSQEGLIKLRNNYLEKGKNSEVNRLDKILKEYKLTNDYINNNVNFEDNLENLVQNHIINAKRSHSNKQKQIIDLANRIKDDYTDMEKIPEFNSYFDLISKVTFLNEKVDKILMLACLIISKPNKQKIDKIIDALNKVKDSKKFTVKGRVTTDGLEERQERKILEQSSFCHTAMEMIKDRNTRLHKKTTDIDSKTSVGKDTKIWSNTKASVELISLFIFDVIFELIPSRLFGNLEVTSNKAVPACIISQGGTP